MRYNGLSNRYINDTLLGQLAFVRLMNKWIDKILDMHLLVSQSALLNTLQRYIIVF